MSKAIYFSPSQGALRNAISTFIHVSPMFKDTIWSYLEQYDLPVVVGSHGGNTTQPITPVCLCCIAAWIMSCCFRLAFILS